MGWWGDGVLDGDAPLDLVLRLEDLLGVGGSDDVDLAHAAGLAGTQLHTKVTAALTNIGLAEAAAAIDCYDEPYLAAQVVAHVAMDLGMDLGDYAAVARRAALLDPHAITDDDRRHAMIAFAARIDRHHSTR